jgi:hypothetical protein
MEVDVQIVPTRNTNIMMMKKNVCIVDQLLMALVALIVLQKSTCMIRGQINADIVVQLPMALVVLIVHMGNTKNKNFLRSTTIQRLKKQIFCLKL